jgi:hypothetical protein
VQIGACTVKLFTVVITAVIEYPGNTKGGRITVTLTSCLAGLDLSVLQIKTKIGSCHTADSKQVKQEVNCTVIFPPLVFPGVSNAGSQLRSSPIFVD